MRSRAVYEARETPCNRIGIFKSHNYMTLIGVWIGHSALNSTRLPPANSKSDGHQGQGDGQGGVGDARGDRARGPEAELRALAVP